MNLLVRVTAFEPNSCIALVFQINNNNNNQGEDNETPLYRIVKLCHSKSLSRMMATNQYNKMPPVLLHVQYLLLP